MSDLAKSALTSPVAGSGVKQLRIAHLINNLHHGGAETMLYRIATGLEGERFTSNVISLSASGPIGEELVRAGIPVRAMGMEIGKFSMGPLLALASAFRREKPDVVMGWMMPSDFLALLVGRMAGIKTIVWNIRNSAVKKEEIGSRNAYLKRLGSRLSAIPAAVVINSTAGLESHEAIGFHPRRWEVIHNGFDLDLLRPDPDLGARVRVEMGIPAAAPVIGLLAHFRPAKNHQMFLKAAQQFSAIHPETHYVLAGHGVDESNEKLRAMAGTLWGTPNLHVLGLRTDVRPILATLDLMTLCSLWEGFPNAVGEAMAMGVPCVVTRTAGDGPRIVGEFGRIIESNDIEACVRVWSELVDNPREMNRLSREARDSISERFSLDAILNQYAALFDSLR